MIIQEKIVDNEESVLYDNAALFRRFA